MNWEGQPSFFHDGAQVLPDDEHPVLLRDCEPLFLFDDEHRSIYFGYQILGVPSKRSFSLTPWGPRKLSICGERRNHSKFKERALSALHVRFNEVGLCRGSQVPHYCIIP